MRASSLGLLFAFGLVACGGEPPPAAAPAEPAAAAPPADMAAPPPAVVAPVASAPRLAAPAASAAPAAAAKHDPKDNPILGKLSEADVQERIIKNTAAFDSCLPDSYKRSSKTIKVQLRPTIGPSGVVNEVKIQKSSGDAKFDACVATAFKKILFPQSRESAFVSPTWVELGGGMVQQQ
jgi:TonB family protein